MPNSNDLRTLALLHFAFAIVIAVLSAATWAEFPDLEAAIRNPPFAPALLAPPPSLVPILPALLILLIVTGFVQAALTALAGWFIHKRSHRGFCLLVAAGNLAAIPFGTALAIYTFLVLQLRRRY